MSDGYGKHTSGFGITREQSVDLIVQSCLDHGISDTRQIAYVLATAQHESGNFRSPEEGWGRKQAVTLAYHGGEAYYGRGYAHLTHHENYRDMGDRLGIGDALVATPQRAAEPEIATRVLVIGMHEGRFTPGHTLDRYINDRQADYEGARAIINSRDAATATPIANLARHWEGEVPALVSRIERDGIDPLPVQAAQAPAMLLTRGDASQDVFEMQQYLAALGMQDGRSRSIAADGDFGLGTEQAVQLYERSLGIDPPTGQVDATLFARLRADSLQADPNFKRRTMTDLYGPMNDGALTRSDKGEPVYELRLQLEGLGYIRNPRRNWSTDRIYDRTIEDAVRALQDEHGLTPTGEANPETRLKLNELAVEQQLAPTTEFDRAENWPPAPPPYTRAEYHLDRAPRAQAEPTMPQPANSRDRQRDDAALGTRPATMDLAAPGTAHARNLDLSHPGHPRHALYRGCAAGVDALDRQLGRASDARSACMKASLAELALRNGLDRVDHVLLSIRSGEVQAGQNVFVVQGALGDPAHRRAHMRTDAAVAKEPEASFREIATLDQGRAGHAVEQARQEQAEHQARSAATRHV
jgi:peptidoglycan hydrolase-like protein with peptidoglycan-binding domain